MLILNNKGKRGYQSYGIKLHNAYKEFIERYTWDFNIILTLNKECRKQLTSEKKEVDIHIDEEELLKMGNRCLMRLRKSLCDTYKENIYIYHFTVLKFAKEERKYKGFSHNFDGKLSETALLDDAKKNNNYKRYGKHLHILCQFIKTIDLDEKDLEKKIQKIWLKLGGGKEVNVRKYNKEVTGNYILLGCQEYDYLEYATTYLSDKQIVDKKLSPVF